MQTALSDSPCHHVGRGMTQRTAPTILKTSISKSPESEEANEEGDGGSQAEPLTSTR